MHIELQPGLVVHISLSLFAYCTLVIAFLYALQMSYITYRLKQKGAHEAVRVPSMQTSDSQHSVGDKIKLDPTVTEYLRQMSAGRDGL